MTAIYSKDSFDRFDDDLCRHLLSYFPLEDGLKYECLSQQWKRTVFQRVFKLVINSSNNLLNKLFSKTQLRDGLPALDSLLKKCPNITYFKITTNSRLETNFFEMLSKYCENLRSIDVLFFGLTQELKNILIDSFGHKLESIVLNDSLNFEIMNRQRLERLRQLDIRLRTGSLFGQFDDSSLPIRGLTHLKIHSMADKDTKILRTIIRSNKLLKCLDITCISTKPKTMNDFLRDVSDLTQLKTLCLRLSFGISSEVNSSLDIIKIIGQKCDKIEKLTIYLVTYVHDHMQRYLEIVDHFPTLVSLTFLINRNRFICLVIGRQSDIRCHLLANCPNLVHLEIHFPELEDNFFEDIHKYLPKLRHLSIIEYRNNGEINDYIERLPDLQTVVIKSLFNSSVKQIDPTIIHKLFENCARLKSVCFNYKNFWNNYFRDYQGGFTNISSFPD